MIIVKALHASQGEEEGGKALEALPAEDQAKIMGAMMSVGMTCAFGGE